MTQALPAAVLGLLLSACGQESPTPAPTSAPPTPATTMEATPSVTASPSPSKGSDGGDADTPEGWQRITVAEQGFSIAVPAEWEELSPDVIDDSGVMEQMLEANPDAAVAIEQGQAAIERGQIGLFAFDPAEAAETGFATNLNVINVGPVEGSAQQAADEVAESIRQQIPIIGEVQTDTTTLPSGDAAVLGYRWQIDDGQGSPTTVAVTQYAIIAEGGIGFILSMSAASETADAYHDVFRQIAQSFREQSS